MSKSNHILYISVLVLITVITLVGLSWEGFNYYSTGLEERFYHPDHEQLKPSGVLGHGMGIIGSLLILIGVFSYMARKRYRFLSRLGLLKHWLEFHIFLCVEGSILILFHTSFKFGGIVSISFWSMVAVVLSGVIGRFIYIQIPRSIEGRVLNLNEIIAIKGSLNQAIDAESGLSDQQSAQLVEMLNLGKVSSHGKNKGFFSIYFETRKQIGKIRTYLKQSGLSRKKRKKLLKLIKQEMTLARRIASLESMLKIFKYWHVAHLPFALIMLIIMLIHVGVTLLFGYKWIF